MAVFGASRASRASRASETRPLIVDSAHNSAVVTVFEEAPGKLVASLPGANLLAQRNVSPSVPGVAPSCERGRLFFRLGRNCSSCLANFRFRYRARAADERASVSSLEERVERRGLGACNFHSAAGRAASGPGLRDRCRIHAQIRHASAGPAMNKSFGVRSARRVRKQRARADRGGRIAPGHGPAPDPAVPRSPRLALVGRTLISLRANVGYRRFADPR